MKVKSMRSVRSQVCLAAMFVTLALQMARAESPSRDQETAHPASTGAAKPAEEKPRRTFHITRSYESADAGKPLTVGDKFHIFSEYTYNPLNWATAGFEAGLEQARNSPEEYGQGGEAFGKRFGASLADQGSAVFFGRFLLPVMLRQDPRYFRLSSGSFGRRTGYALSRVLITRTDSGKRAVNFSLLGGALASGALSNAYYPDQSRGAGLTLSRFGFGLLGAAAANLGHEFWPDVRRKLFAHSAKASTP